jgi:hypothetical protein
MKEREGGMKEPLLGENLPFQRREWRVQRFAWWLLGAFVLAAALGLFGNGVLSHAEVRSPDGSLAIGYERFLRSGRTMRLVVEVSGTGALELHVNREYFENLKIDRITPEPESVAVGADDVRLTFAAGPAGGRTILFDAEPLHMGRYQAAFGLAPGTAAVQFRQLVYF